MIEDTKMKARNGTYALRIVLVLVLGFPLFLAGALISAWQESLWWLVALGAPFGLAGCAMVILLFILIVTDLWKEAWGE